MDPISANQNSAASIATLQQTLTGEIDQRLDALSSFAQSLQANTAMSTTEQQSLETEITNEETGLQALRTTVGNETTKSALQADAKTMVDDYRVFRVEGPKVHLAERLANQEQKIETLQSSVDNSVEQGGTPALTDAQQQLDAARTALAGSDALLALTPQDYTTTMFDQFRDAAQMARTDIAAAHHDLTTE